MRVCLICEGSYPYVRGGVASWVQTLCRGISDIDFVVYAIATSREEMSDFVYDLPDNVTDVQTLYLEDAFLKKTGKKVHLRSGEKRALESLVAGESAEIDWMGIVEMARHHRGQLGDLLMSESFFDVCLDEYRRQRSRKVFLQFLWNFRNIYFPVMHVLSREMPHADLYHAVSAGYAGILGSSVSVTRHAPFLLSEHGIYSREREEDIIRAQWLQGEFKIPWIDYFRKQAFIAYQQADVVTTLFETNRTLQIELNCPPEKIVVVPNGVDVHAFDSCYERRKRDAGRTKHGSGITLGAVLRVVPIKDVRTMLLAFDIVKRTVPNARLKLMGNTEEDPAYYRECRDLLSELGTHDVEFLGHVDIREHMPDIDLLLLSSISEGQPLAMLEGMAAGIPFVVTDVGNCRALLEGEYADDHFGSAGVVVPVMDSAAMAQAILRCVRSPDQLRTMGEAGRKRVETYYTREGMLDAFRDLYEDLGGRRTTHGRDRIRA